MLNSPAEPATSILPCIATDLPSLPNWAGEMIFCVCVQAGASNRYTAPLLVGVLTFNSAVTAAVVPLTATDQPKKLLAAPLEAASRVPCPHPAAEHWKTYAAPVLLFS